MPEILLVEDNSADILLMEEALLYGPYSNRVHVARDGVDALSFLARTGPHQNAPRPDLILLDINMPRMDGRGVLSWLKDDESLRSVPVVVLSTTTDEKDVEECLRLGAKSFYTKPPDLDEFTHLIEEVQRIWLGGVELDPDEKAQA